MTVDVIPYAKKNYSVTRLRNAKFFSFQDISPPILIVEGGALFLDERQNIVARATPAAAGCTKVGQDTGEHQLAADFRG